jgi:hypothetical protein
MAVLELATDRRQHIAQYARGALVAAGAMGKTPTPLEDVTAALNLHPPEDLFGLGRELPPGLLARVGKLAGKVLGALAIGERTIYIDMQQERPRRRFTHGHELGHKALPWHAESYFGDDYTTLRPDTRDELEAEANAFSAAVLFNLDQFSDQAHAYQPGLAVPLGLADSYQTSRHATIRRYVEDAPRPVGLAVLGRYLNHAGGRTSMVMRQGIESAAFRERYGPVAECLPARPPIDDYELAKDAYAAVFGVPVEPVIKGQMTIVTPQRGNIRMDYEIFFNRHQVFALLVPSKMRIFQQRVSAEWSPQRGDLLRP